MARRQGYLTPGIIKEWDLQTIKLLIPEWVYCTFGGGQVFRGHYVVVDTKGYYLTYSHDNDKDAWTIAHDAMNEAFGRKWAMAYTWSGFKGQRRDYGYKALCMLYFDEKAGWTPSFDMNSRMVIDAAIDLLEMNEVIDDTKANVPDRDLSVVDSSHSTVDSLHYKGSGTRPIYGDTELRQGELLRGGGVPPEVD